MGWLFVCLLLVKVLGGQPWSAQVGEGTDSRCPGEPGNISEGASSLHSYLRILQELRPPAGSWQAGVRPGLGEQQDPLRG